MSSKLFLLVTGYWEIAGPPTVRRYGAVIGLVLFVDLPIKDSKIRGRNHEFYANLKYNFRRRCFRALV